MALKRSRHGPASAIQHRSLGTLPLLNLNIGGVQRDCPANQNFCALCDIDCATRGRMQPLLRYATGVRWAPYPNDTDRRRSVQSAGWNRPSMSSRSGCTQAPLCVAECGVGRCHPADRAFWANAVAALADVATIAPQLICHPSICA